MDLCVLVGRNVRRRRLGAGLTQEEMAYRAGIDRTYLSDIERGIRNPTISLLQEIAAVVGAHPAVLLVEAHHEAQIAGILQFRGPANS
jgi:transcriptional regulator with XRE-family HTH domain